MTVWKASVEDLIRLFRMAIVSLLPTMDKVHIAWREGEAYDDWDEIAEVLYRNIVGRSLQSAVGNDPELDTLLPRYNMRLSTYANRNNIGVTGNVLDKPTAFIGLSSKRDPFDTVDYVLLDANGDIVSEISRCSLEDAGFNFCYRTSREPMVLEALEIYL